MNILTLTNQTKIIDEIVLKYLKFISIHFKKCEYSFFFMEYL